MFNRFCMIMILLAMTGILFGQSNDGLQLSQPQFSNPFYDSFARNFTGTIAAGRGYTGVATMGDISTLCLNPATNLPDSAKIVAELNIKPQINADGYVTEASYTSLAPLGLVAVGMGIGHGFSAGLAYNNPRSIRLDDFSMFKNQGAAIEQRFPAYYLHQFSASLAHHRGPLHLGLNLHNQLHFVDDNIFWGSYDRVREYAYSLRIQPGIIYETSAVNLGLTGTLPSSFNWDLRHADYKVKQPLELSAGVAYTTSRMSLAAEAQWEQTSKVDEAFDDRLSLKAGFEKYLGWLSYRVGYMYIPEVFSGEISLPVDESMEADPSPDWDSVPDSLIIETNNQHYATLGLSYMHRDGAIHLALVQSLSNKAPHTQVNLSLSFYLHSFRRKGLFKFDD